MNENLEKLGLSGDMNQNIKKFGLFAVMALGGLIIIISCFLDYLSASAFGFSLSASLWETGDGKYFIVVVIICLIFAFINLEKGYTVMAFIVAGFTLFEVQDYAEEVGKLPSEVKDMVSRGPGFWLMIVGTIILVGGAVAKVVMAKRAGNSDTM